MSFTHFSKHAFERIGQRTKLPCQQIAEILDQKFYVNTGKKPGFDREHLVFYSEPDDDYFVAIRDCVSGTVVTVLPLEYQERLAWKISEKDQLKSKEIFLNSKLIVKKLDTPGNAGPTRFLVCAHYIPFDGKQKTKVILKVDSLPYKNRVENLLNEKAIFAKINEQLALLKGEIYELIGITIRHGSRGEPIMIDYS